MTDLFESIIRGSVSTAMRALAGLDESRRRRIGTELVAHVRRRRDNWWAYDEATALAVVCVGSLPTAATAAELLGRESVWLHPGTVPPVIETARERGVSWLPELAHRLADRLRQPHPSTNWSFIAQLLVEEKAPPPTGNWFVEGWVAEMSWPVDRHAWPADLQRPTPLVDRLRADPFLGALVPRLFEVDGLGHRMMFTELPTHQKLALPHALAQLADEGSLDRIALLDGCLGRLLRGDRPTALRPFVALHTLLEPTPAEITTRRHSYLRLLADAPGAVATMAGKALRGLAEIDLDALLHTSRIVLLRPEKALVLAQLRWLDRLARKHPGRAAEIALVLATAIDHPAVDLSDRAAALAAKHGHQAGPNAVVVTPDPG